jgi:uncharacterized protein (TIGR02996 family)
MTHNDFMQEILANPDDDTPRLIYADWLEEHGEYAQSDFIRAQCELAKLSPDDPLYSRAQIREHATRLKWAPSWTGSLSRWALNIRPRRGFAGLLRTTTIPSFVRDAAALLQSAPIQHVVFSRGEPYLHQLLSCPQLENIRTIDIEAPDFSIRSYRTLTNCPRLSALVGLGLGHGANLKLAAAKLFVESPHLKNLRTLYCPELAPQVQQVLTGRFRLHWCWVYPSLLGD